MSGKMLSEDYEESERITITAGKSQIPNWLKGRHITKQGLFAVVTENDLVHPNHYQVSTEDGIGTKLFLAPWMDDFSRIGWDGVAMNAIDFATLVRAWPTTVNLYFAVSQRVKEEKHQYL